LAFGFSPIIPLQQSEEDGFYALTKTIAENVKLNFKNLLLTAPGERVMIPHFGAGLRNYLFNNRSGTIRADITQRIEEQVAEYLPYLAIENIEFFMPEDDFATEQATTQMGIQISYSVSNFNFSDMLKIEKINFI
tara:strand:+ start:9731 stop:10135 length:405 start_codon:yes stop_codon:yes gene_type:complete